MVSPKASYRLLLSSGTPRLTLALTLTLLATHTDEAALYDRQIRLWGVEAQSRIRHASILIINLRGLATEAIKNIVLAGIGTLTILDTSHLHPQHLGTGFFFRNDDLGKNRAEAAIARISALNPRVTMRTVKDVGLLEKEDFLKRFNLVCLTDGDITLATSLNDRCRALSIPFYSAASYGLSGYVFCDLIEHEFTHERQDQSAPKPSAAPRLVVKVHASFVPLSSALAHQWPKNMRKQEIRRLNPMLGGVLAVWEYQKRNQGLLPDSPATHDQLVQIAETILPERNLPAQFALPSLSLLSSTSHTDFMPSCAILGGLLGQDILNAVGGKEPPISNLYVFDGFTCKGEVYSLGSTSLPGSGS